MRINLLEETLKILRDHNKTPNDVEWVGDNCLNVYCSWEEFEKQAARIEYDNGYGVAHINPHMVVVGEDWWLERAEYDGAEWWEFKTPLIKPDNKVHQLPI